MHTHKVVKGESASPCKHLVPTPHRVLGGFFYQPSPGLFLTTSPVNHLWYLSMALADTSCSFFIVSGLLTHLCSIGIFLSTQLEPLVGGVCRSPHNELQEHNWIGGISVPTPTCGLTQEDTCSPPLPGKLTHLKNLQRIKCHTPVLTTRAMRLQYR